MKKRLQQLVQAAIVALQQQKKLTTAIDVPVHIERTRAKEHGDFATNAAMMLAKACDCKPRDLASWIVANLPADKFIREITIAGPGFINFFLTNDAYLDIVPQILTAANEFGRTALGANRRINIEFVSSNPTGPLHVGHGRSVAYGASVANLLDNIGFQAHREYYVNDAGRQMDILTVSIWLRYLEQQGLAFKFPTNGYKGDYIFTIAQELEKTYHTKLSHALNDIFANVPADEVGEIGGDKEAHIDGLITNAKKLLGDDYPKITAIGLNYILSGIKEDLANFGLEYQEWFSEKKLSDTNAIQRVIDKLRESGHTYEREEATWFNATAYGDDKDRVLIRANGQTTYFASDAAYLLNKIERGFEQIIYIFGADHHGYVARLQAVAKALGTDAEKIKILLVQFASLYRGKEKVQMSTRSGSFVTLRELYEEIGKDAARFFYVMRKSEQAMDFDLELAKSQSADNPVYYIQYAHARIASVFRQLAEKGWQWNKAQGLQNLACLVEDHERTLLCDLSRYQETVTHAALNFEPHLLANYLRELAYDLHTFYNAHQFLVDDSTLRNARLCLIAAVQQILLNGLTLLNVSAPKTM